MLLLYMLELNLFPHEKSMPFDMGRYDFDLVSVPWPQCFEDVSPT